MLDLFLGICCFLMIVIDWVFQKQMRRSLVYRLFIRDQSLWKGGKGSKTGQGKKSNCIASLEKPWLTPQGVGSKYSPSQISLEGQKLSDLYTLAAISHWVWTTPERCTVV